MLYRAAHKLSIAAVAAGLAGLAAVFSTPVILTARPMAIDMHEVKLNDGHMVWFSRYEVTRKEWKACHDDGGCDYAPAALSDANYFNYPMVGINYFDAVEYVAWINRTSGRHYRLPNAAEWNMAAAELQRVPYKKLFDDPRLA